jgi:hypothetical protein
MKTDRVRVAASLAMVLAVVWPGVGSVSAQDAEKDPAASPLPLCLDPSPGESIPPCPLEAGTYAPEAIAVPMTFTIDEGWSNLRSFPDLWVIGGMGDYLGFVVGPLELSDGRTISSADELLSLLESDTAIESSDPVPVTVGGRPATAIDVTNVGDSFFELFLASDRFFLEPGDMARFIVLEGGDTATAFIVEGYGELGLPGAIERTQPIIDSVVWLDDATTAEGS